MTTSSPIALAAGQITRADRLTIELVKPQTCRQRS
jgi:hypothetical protein